jgi:hypothetical protein
MSSNHVHDGLQTDEPTFISFGEERNAAGFFQIFWEARRSERMRTESWEGTEGHRPSLYRCRRCTVDTEQGDGARAHGLAIGHWWRWLYARLARTEGRVHWVCVACSSRETGRRLLDRSRRCGARTIQR